MLLGRYAVFLSYFRNNHNEAEEYFKRAIAVDPKNTNNLGNYAHFLRFIRKNNEEAETYYKRAIEVKPKDSGALTNYGVFLFDVHKDPDGAEPYLKQAVEADPKNTIAISNYGFFLQTARKDYEGAEELYKQVIEASPQNSIIVACYGGLLLGRGRKREAVGFLQDALSMSLTAKNMSLSLLCLFYAYAHLVVKEPGDALREMKALLVDTIRSPECDLSPNVAQAKKEKHPEVEWLQPLADVIADNAPLSTLDVWPAWSAA